MKQSKRGFTLMEIIIVLAALAILALIAVPRLIVLVNEAQEKADIASIKTLNDVTATYRASLDDYAGDVFSGIDSDEARMQTLVDNKLIGDIPKPQQHGASFNWDVDSQTWVLSTGDEAVPLAAANSAFFGV